MMLRMSDHSTVSLILIWRQERVKISAVNIMPSDIRTWFSNVEQHATEGVNKILIGNKCDWEEKRIVSTERGQQLADELGIPFMEVSAKNNINIDKAFYTLASDIKARIMDTAKSEQPTTGLDVGTGGSGNGIGGKCC
jgi:GTPase SAR1 family protein